MTALAHSVAIEPVPGADVLRPLGHWPKTLFDLLRDEPAVVRVVIASLRGSGPREAGACMLVTRGAVAGSVGGGHLEWQAITAARALLDASPGSAQLKRHVLGIELGQCCGGVVELWYERFDTADRTFVAAIVSSMETQSSTTALKTILEGRRATRQLRHTARRESIRLVRGAANDITLIESLEEIRTPLWLFGAGHVGHAIVRLLEGLPFRLVWVDTRAELFPEIPAGNTEQFCPADPVSMIAKTPAGTRFLVLTHDHALDYALVRAVLDRDDDFAFLGVIGSDSKGARFRSRLARDGVHAEKIARLICPIGVAGIASKQPAAIAISVIAQLLQGLADPSQASTPGLALKADDDCPHATPGGCVSCGNRTATTTISRKY